MRKWPAPTLNPEELFLFCGVVSKNQLWVWGREKNPLEEGPSESYFKSKLIKKRGV
jgi:hypothetical protein